LLGASLAAAKLGAAQSPSPVVSTPVPPTGLSLPPARTPDFIASGMWQEIPGCEPIGDIHLSGVDAAMLRATDPAEDARFNRRTTL